jgi:hypothetical protein
LVRASPFDEVDHDHIEQAPPLPGQFLMERRMLLGIKQRAESSRSRCC